MHISATLFVKSHMLNHKFEITQRHVELPMSSHTCQITHLKSHITSHTSQITHVESPMSNHTCQITHVESHIPDHTCQITGLLSFISHLQLACIKFTFLSVICPIMPTNSYCQPTFLTCIREMERNNDISWVCLHPLGQNISRTCYLKRSFFHVPNNLITG